ncbi:tyrosine-type recombinase/integrase [Pontibacterium sp. N1Y112]|uniref:Tyrosine-type recombinase/integrase n=1 Tax=Pontibacterium sinense TaxID=2781979 RepID=A0A8J7K614_9GAMM|nr:tyrosine-type recombinase/integrase [Pontibacterium sinense]MBE9397790.1 tyrosine-type recombinase/integrase [Pontibacterium sinense]
MAKSVVFNGFEGFAEPGVEVRGLSIRIYFNYRSKQEKPRFCSIENVHSVKQFQDLLDEASDIQRLLDRMSKRGTLTDEIYATHLPESELAKNRGGSRATVNFKQLAQRYLDDQEPLVRRGDISGGTVESRRKALITSQHMNKLSAMRDMPKNHKHTLLYQQGLGDMRIGDITFDVLRKLQTYLYDYAPRETGKFGYSEKYVNNILDAIRQVFKYALQHQIVEKDPSENIKTLRVPTKNKLEEQMFFDFEEQEAIYQACIDDNKPCLAEAFKFGCWTGLRKEELLALAWEDINLEANSVTVTRAYTREDEFHHPKTKTSYRSIELLDDARDALDRAYQHTSEAEPKTFMVKRPEQNGRVPEELRLVFQNFAKGGPIPRAWNEGSLRKAWNRIKKLSGVDLPFKYVRHTYGSMRMSAGGMEEEVADEMGHNGTTMVHRHYTVQSNKFNKQMIASKNKAMSKLKEELAELE